MKRIMLGIALVLALAVGMQPKAHACNAFYGEEYVYRVIQITVYPYFVPQQACYYPDLDMEGNWYNTSWTDLRDDTQPPSRPDPD